MTTEWPIEIDGDEYHPVPESWIEHGDDHNSGHPRVFAVSVGWAVRDLIDVRYIHPRQQRVYIASMSTTEQDDGVVPSPLASPRSTWPRSLVPQAHIESSDVARSPEIAHLRELWSDRIETVANSGGQIDV